MPEVPKIVHERLRVADRGADAHPDANVLTAFAEQALSPTERESVLAHLSACDECRELLAVRSPDLEVVPAVVGGGRTEAARAAGSRSARGARSWFAWNRLGWAGLAAGAVIAFAVLVTRPPKQKPFEEARQSAASAPAPVAAPPVAATDAAKLAALPPSSEPAVTAARQPVALAPAARRDELRKLATPASSLSEGGAVENKLEALGAKKDMVMGSALKRSAPQRESATETAEVAAAAPVPAAPSQTFDTLSANEAAPVTKAKAARVLDAPAAMQTVTANTKQAEAQKEAAQSSAGQLRSSSDARMSLADKSAYGTLQRSQLAAQWRIRGDQVERSLDSGTHWDSVFQPHLALLSVAAGNGDVWAGGKGGVLFHSANSGLTWTQIHPTVRGEALAGDIIHIDISSSTNIALSTSKNETWDTSDGGTTWEKK